MDPMIKAVETGNIDDLYKIIKEDPYVLERIDEKPFLDTPLHLAACTDHLPFLLEMISLKPSFGRKLNQDGLSPMHLALQYGKNLAVSRLLKFDKDLVRVKGKEGMTPFHHAVQFGNLDVLMEFLEACPEAIEDVTVRDETAFHIALKHDQFDAFEVLVGWLKRSCHKAAPSWEKQLLVSGDFQDNSVLHIAVINKSPQAVRLLLENFSLDYINAKNLEGLTALDLALSKQEESNESKSESDNPDSIYNMLSNCGGLTGKMSNSSAGENKWFRWVQEKPNYSIKNVDALRSKMSSYKKVKTAIARGKGGISESMRNTFLVVTVLIITATYTASLQPPKKDKDKEPEIKSLQNLQIYSSQSTSSASASASSSSSSTASGPATSTASSAANANANANATANSSTATPPSGPPSVLFDLALPDLYSLFWLYNTLTFWASVWLTAFLLPANCIFSVFILITLSLFASCYMLLMVASVSSDHQFYEQRIWELSTDNWYYSISVVNYISSSLLALLVAHRIAFYVSLKLNIMLLRTRRMFLLLILLLAFLLVVGTILFPAMLFSEIMWRNYFPYMYEVYNNNDTAYNN